MLNASATHSKWNQTAWQSQQLLPAEQQWGYQVSAYPVLPQGNPIEAALEMLTVYASAPQNYAVTANVDHVGHDLTQTQTTNVAVLAWLCDQEPACLGLYVSPVCLLFFVAVLIAPL